MSKTICVHNMFSPCSPKRRASDKDLHVKENNEKTKDVKVIQISSTAERTKIWVKDGKTYKSVNFPKFIQRLHTGGQR